MDTHCHVPVVSLATLVAHTRIPDNGLDRIGALIDMKAFEKVEAHIADAVKKGGKVFTGGTRAA